MSKKKIAKLIKKVKEGKVILFKEKKAKAIKTLKKSHLI